jgi:hypothetical protein
MTPLEDQIRDLYRQVTDAEQPPARVSIAEVLRQGRFLRRRRRFSIAAAPVVAAAAAAGIALAATLPAYVHRAAPVRPPIANPAPAPGQFDPLVVSMSIGWLPPGEAALTGATGALNGSLIVYQERNLNLNTYGSRDANTRWRLSDYSRRICAFDGRHHRLLCNGQSILSGAAPDINGHSAYWESGYGPQHAALVWEYAPGYWAELVSVGLQQSDQTLLRIAGSVAFGGDAAQPVKFAVQLTGVPSRWRIGSTSVTRVSGNWLAQDANLTTGKRALWADDGGTYNGLPEVTTYLGGGNCNQLYQFPDHPQWLRINGYQVESATNPHDPSVTSLCAPHAHGLLVFESLQRRPHGPRVSLTTLFRRMRVLGPKPSAWTTRPIEPLVVSSAVGFVFVAAIAVLALVVIVVAVTVAVRRRAASLVRS